MSYTPNIKRGVWKAVCGVCGFKFNSNELKKRWDGLYVCEKDWEPRHILDFFKVKEEKLSVPWVQKDTEAITNYADLTTTDSPYTATSSIQQIDVDATAGNVTINLPLASTYTFAYSGQLKVRRTDATSNTVTIARQGGDTINGATSETIAVHGSKTYQNDASTSWRTF